MHRRPPRSTRTYTLFPDTTLFRSDQLASACFVQVLVQRLHRDTLTNLARVEAIPAATDDPCVGCILGVRRGPGDKLFPAVSRSGVVAGPHDSHPLVVIAIILGIQAGQHLRKVVGAVCARLSPRGPLGGPSGFY